MEKDELARFIAGSSELSALERWVKNEFARQLRKDPGHDISHSHRVALWTLKLGKGFRVEAAVAAALLHDLINPPKTSPDRKNASEVSASQAKKILPRFGFDGVELDDICAAIRTHSFSRGEDPVSALGCALQDADRLEALGAIGLYRVISTGVLLGLDLYDAADPWARSRDLDDSKHSVDHFFQKLLRLPATMKTDAGRIEAEKRAVLLREFLMQLGSEIGEPCSMLP